MPFAWMLFIHIGRKASSSFLSRPRRATAGRESMEAVGARASSSMAFLGRRLPICQHDIAWVPLTWDRRPSLRGEGDMRLLRRAKQYYTFTQSQAEPLVSCYNVRQSPSQIAVSRSERLIFICGRIVGGEFPSNRHRQTLFPLLKG
jgi:hypothetical protein